MVDISTGWLECMPLMKKSAADIINGFEVARSLMLYPAIAFHTSLPSPILLAAKAKPLPPCLNKYY